MRKLSEMVPFQLIAIPIDAWIIPSNTYIITPGLTIGQYIGKGRQEGISIFIPIIRSPKATLIIIIKKAE